MKVATRKEGDPRGAVFLSRVTFLAGGEENDRILVVRLLRLFSLLIFLPQKKK